MRYIDTSSIDVPDDWLDLAKADLGNNYPSLWSYFKLAIETLVTKKCWYSESCNIGSINPIDHFRPKANKVKAFSSKYGSLDKSVWSKMNFKGRVGYPYLKFEFSNYRYTCDIVNSSNKKETLDNTTKGKSNFFPLKLNSPLGTTLENINGEQICLLDPCNMTDPGYLTFNEFGKINPHIAALDTSWEYCKVLISIEIYHLHYPNFIEKRKELWDYCKERIELADRIYIKTAKTLEEEACLSAYIKELNKKISKSSEFSAVAIDCISFYKKEYIWLDTVFSLARLVK